MTHRIRLATLLILLAGFSLPTQSYAFQVNTLKSGLTVITEENHSVNLVAIDVWVKAGSGHETAKNNGVSHFVEHLTYGATSTRKPGQMDLEMESVGATLDARTSRDWAHFSTTVDSDHLDKALDVLHDAVTNAAFYIEDVEHEKSVILDEIAKKLSNPQAVCRDYLAKSLYGAHPYGMPVEGTPEIIKNMSHEDVVAYHRARYLPGNMAVVIVGDVDKSKAVAAVTKAFGEEASPAPSQATYPSITPPEKQITTSVKSPFKRAYYGWAFLGPRASDTTDICATDILLTYLGMGYHSWMSDTLKGKMHLADEVSADYLTQCDPGMISLVVAGDEANLDKAKAAIEQEIQRIKTQGISQSDLKVAKRSLLGQFAFDCETFAGRANALGFYFAVSDVGFVNKYNAAIQAITNNDIIKVAGKYLDTEHSVTVTLSPSKGEAR